MASHSESEMAVLSQEPVSIKNSKLTEGALVPLENSAKPEIRREHETSHMHMPIKKHNALKNHVIV